MIQRLVIFGTSERPDPYLNVIMHSALFLGVQEFELVAVSDSLEDKGEAKAARVSENLSLLVALLQEGKYGSVGAAGNIRTRPVEDATRFQDILRTIKWDSLVIARRGLSEDQLPDFLAKEIAKGSAFDVTSCKNSLVVGLTAALVAKSRSDIYTFEFREKPTFDERDLLPVLTQTQYVYRRLSEAPLVQDAVKQIRAFSLSRKRFLYAAVVLAIVFALFSLILSQTIIYSLLTGFASFAGIVTAIGIFVRE